MPSVVGPIAHVTNLTLVWWHSEWYMMLGVKLDKVDVYMSVETAWADWVYYCFTVGDMLSASVPWFSIWV